jgi:hypothetical protein
MATSLVSFNAVRPVLFAGTLAVAWLAFSAPSGAADTGVDSGPVLGTISAAASPVSSTAPGATDIVGSGLDPSAAAVAGSAVASAPAPRPSAPTPPVAYLAAVSGPLQSVPEGPAVPVGVPVIPVPVVNGLDPAGTVAMATEPVVEIVSPVVDMVPPVVEMVPPVVDVVPPPVVDVIPPVVGDVALPDEALQPVAEVVADVAPLLVSDFIPGAVDDRAVMVLSRVSAVGTGAAAVGSTGLWSAGPFSTLTPGGLLTGLLTTLLASAAVASSAGPGFQTGAGAARGSSTRGSSRDAMPEPMRSPVSGSGSGQSSGGSQSPAAWLSNVFEYLSLPGDVPVSGLIQHAPAPVSFDPGSSPD